MPGPAKKSAPMQPFRSHEGMKNPEMPYISRLLGIGKQGISYSHSIVPVGFGVRS